MWPDIGGRAVGPQAPVFAVAEIGLNHGGDLSRALQMVDAAAQSGASAIKLQTIFADRLVADAGAPPVHVAAESLRAFFARFELDADAHRAVFARARQHGLAVLSTPFAEDAVPMLEGLGIDAYKIASGDVTYDGLIAAAARTGKPVIISTGMSSLEESARAVRVARLAGAGAVAVLHCVSAYPTPAGSENLRAIDTLASALGVPVGLSDHSSGGLVSAVAAVALGACIYERHFRLAEGPDPIDAAVSSTPEQFAAIVAAMEQARMALGDGRKCCMPAEAANVVPSRRGLYAARDLPAGHVVTAADVLVLRPAAAFCPADLAHVVGQTTRRDIAAGAPFDPGDFSIRKAS